jgi:DNA-binding beta-propeller fold protein YncE
LISGASTGLTGPNGIAIDTVRDEMFVTNNLNNSVTVYPRASSGNAIPIRSISGSSTGLSSPQGIAVDMINDEIFVSNQHYDLASGSCNDSITVYARTANGNAFPVRTISVGPACQKRPYGIAVDTLNNEIYVTAGAYYVDVYSRTASGSATPIRTIRNPTEGL